MSQMRRDPVTGVWTVVATGRAGRPKEVCRTPVELVGQRDCPFCPGHENMTPPTRWEASLSGAQGWMIRVVENKFPALLAPDGADVADESAPEPYLAQSGFGVHEVIIETPQHDQGLADFSDEQSALLVDAYARRLTHWREDGRFAAAMLFRNWGWAAGASLEHAHTQLVAMPRVPEAVVRELGNFSQAAAGGRACVLCDAIRADDEAGRTIWDDGKVIVQSPFAAPIAYFMRIAPRECSPTFETSAEDERASLGAAMTAAARALRGTFGDVAFNMVVHIAPYTAGRAGLPFHWHADVVLRTSDQAGFEWGSGTYINVVDPDEAAVALRAGLSAP